jgi:hypothetical protein
MISRRISGFVLFALCGAAGCSTYSTYRPVSIDCTADSGYDLDPVDMSSAFTYGDTTTGAVITAAVTPLPDNPRCANASALLITAHRFNDWGAATGFYAFGPADPTDPTMAKRLTRNESAYTGVSFWARAPGATGKSFTIVLDDFNTADPTPLAAGSSDPTTDPDPMDSNCIGYATPDGGMQNVTIYDPATGMVLSSGSTTVTALNACGNAYQVIPTVANDWAFYTIPFGQFHQTAQPNRVPNDKLTETGTAPGTSLLTSKLRNFLIRIPKATDMELWIDNLGFYRKKGSVVGADGGTDAR